MTDQMPHTGDTTQPQPPSSPPLGQPRTPAHGGHESHEGHPGREGHGGHRLMMFAMSRGHRD